MDTDNKIENNKYYTPEIEEFCIGFEFEEEFNNPNWTKMVRPVGDNYEWVKLIMSTSHSISRITSKIKKQKIRVKYLDKNDIEEVLKVKQLKGDDINLNFQILLDDSEDFYEINYDLDTKILNIELLKENEEGSHNTYTLFSYGVIKNKTEFKKLLNQLGVYGNNK